MNGTISEGKGVKIKSRDFGEIEVNADEVITFPGGLFAFEDMTEYVLINPLGQDEYPMWLQSAQAEKPCFIVFDPTAIIPGYKPHLSDNERAVLGLTEDTKVKYLVIAVVHEDHTKTTVNLKCPIIINTEQKLAAQVILSDDYSFRQPIFDSEKGA